MSTSMVLTTDGRPYLAPTRESAAVNLPKFDHTVLIDDSGTRAAEAFYGLFDEVVVHEYRRGLGGAVQSAWDAVRGAEWVFHMEDDWTFNHPIDVEAMRAAIEQNPYLAQMCLKRQPVNELEERAGGFVQLEIEQYRHQEGWLERRHIFSLNPCLIPGWVLEVSKGGLEAEITSDLVADPDVWFGVWGLLSDAPQVEHVGHQRAAGWKL